MSPSRSNEIKHQNKGFVTMNTNKIKTQYINMWFPGVSYLWDYSQSSQFLRFATTIAEEVSQWNRRRDVSKVTEVTWKTGQVLSP